MKKRKIPKIAVVGSRDFSDYKQLSKHLKPLLPFVLVSGGAKGADQLAEQFADKHHLKKIIHKPDWNKYGRAAGFVRNTKIVLDSNALVAFWDGKSKGTKNSIDKAIVHEIDIIIIFF